ncbi:hypothetical protein D3C77_708020 [compost metagenome]
MPGRFHLAQVLLSGKAPVYDDPILLGELCRLDSLLAKRFITKQANHRMIRKTSRLSQCLGRHLSKCLKQRVLVMRSHQLQD